MTRDHRWDRFWYWTAVTAAVIAMAWAIAWILALL